MNYIRQHPLLASLLINIVLFSAVSVFGFPIYNSGDDVFLLYLLGGGFGSPPTELVHYHYGMHPYMGLIIKNLFTSFPDYNWYTALLYFFHFITCSIILWQWINRNTVLFSILAYLVCFAAIEARFLLQPTFTNTAFITAAGGLLILYDGLKSQHRSRFRLIAGCALIIITSLFRLHLLIPTIIIALPFFIVAVQRKQFKQFVLYIVTTAIIIAAFSFLQQQYYTKHIPGWQKAEAYRQAVIHHYNIPKKIEDTLPDRQKINAQFLETGILWDKTFLSRIEIKATTAAVAVTGAWRQDDFKERIYWLALESRISIAIMILLLLWKFPSLNAKEKKATLASALLFFCLCLALLLFRKLPPYIIPGGVLTWMVFTATPGEKHTINSRFRSWLFTIAGLLLLGWSTYRLNKLNRWNKQQHLQWQCAYKQVAASPKTLFVVTDDKFPTDYFHVWDLPKRYSLPNLLYKDHFLNNPWSNIYQRFGLLHPMQFPGRNTVVFTGNPSESIRRYLELVTGQKAGFIEFNAAGNCIPTWQISGVHIP